jgi:thymidine phosphorylase
VESVPLITASILSKKLAAGLQGLVLDVKVGSGAFMPTPEAARALAQSLVRTATGAGLKTRALLTDMNQVLGRTAGNALETREAIDFLTGREQEQEPRQLELTLRLSAELLLLGGLAGSMADALARARQALASGAAAERFARMVAALGGPRDVLRDAALPPAPVRLPVLALRSGYLARMDVRALGLAVVALGGGRTRPQDRIDPRVGLAAVLPLGARVETGAPLAWVHAASEDAAQAAVRAVQGALVLEDSAPPAPPLVIATIDA